MYSIIHKCFILVHIHCQRWAPKTAVMLSFFRPYMYYPQVCCTCLYSIPVVGTKTAVLSYLLISNSSGGHQKRPLTSFKLYRSNNMYYPQVFPTCSYSILLVGTKNGRPYILYRSNNMYYPQVFHTCSYASTVTSMFVFVCLTPVLHC